MKKLSISMTRTESILGWCYLFLNLLVFPVVLTLVNTRLGRPFSEAQLNLFFFFINFAAIVLLGHRFLWNSLKAAIAAPFRTLRWAGVGFIVYYASTLLIVMLILRIRPDFANINDSAIAQMSQEHFALFHFATVLLVPLVEEFLHRGLIFGSLYRRSRVAAYLVSAVIFSAIHVVGYIGAFDWELLALCFLQYLPAGICLSWAYVSADNIWAPILMHITVNQIGMQAMR